MTTLTRAQTPSRTNTAARGARYSGLPVSRTADGGGACVLETGLRLGMVGPSQPETGPFYTRQGACFSHAAHGLSFQQPSFCPILVTIPP